MSCDRRDEETQYYTQRVITDVLPFDAAVIDEVLGEFEQDAETYEAGG